MAAAESAITAMLQAHPEIDAVFAAHGNPGPGAVAAVKNVGKEGKIQIMGFDFGMPVVEGIDKGQIRGTVGQNPYLMGYVGMMMAWAANQRTTGSMACMHRQASIRAFESYIRKTSVFIKTHLPSCQANEKTSDHPQRWLRLLLRGILILPTLRWSLIVVIIL